jgi:BirA family biotin operon repressor/biotin-[acetyl-CoA-carboxylase] ligase
VKRSFGEVIYRLDTVSSTQDTLKDLFQCREVLPGAVVVARAQSQGRGRRDNAWDSPTDLGLWMSILVLPVGPEEYWTWTPLWAGLAVKRALADLLSDQRSCDPNQIELKWPNDLMIGNTKLGGILTERVQNGVGQAVVLGVGVNLSHRREDFPPHLRDRAASLLQVSGQSYSPDSLLEKVTAQFERLYPLLNPINPGLIGEIWLNHAWGLKARLGLSSNGQQYSGLFIGLGEYGEIRLEAPVEGVRQFAHAEHIVRIE